MPIRSMLAALAILAVLAACEKKESPFLKQLKEMAKENKGGNGAGEATTGDPCSLLDTTEVAAGIGPLASPPYHGTYKPQSGSESCRYDTQDHRRLLVSVDWSGGPMAMKMIHFGRGLTDGISKNGEMKTGQTVLSSGDTLVGDWDEIAQGPMQCCDLHALRGDQHVELDYTGTKLTPVAAGALLNSAIKRLDHPLSINGEAGLQLALQNYAKDAKDSAVNMCALVPQAAAESILGVPLLGPPQPGPQPGGNGLRDCTYKTATPGMPDMPRTYNVAVWEWRDGAVEFAQDQYVIASATHALRKQMPIPNQGQAPPDTSQGPAGPWEEIGPSASMGWEAVKGPYMLKASAFGDSKGTVALMARAVTALSAPH